MSTLNNELHDTVDEKIVLYTPIYEEVEPDQLQSQLTWSYINTSQYVKKFYLSKEHLFNTHPDAPGCYKIVISWAEIIRHNSNIKIDLENKSVFAMALSLSTTEIESYVMRNNFQEYTNPFRNHQLNLNPPINTEKSTTITNR